MIRGLERATCPEPMDHNPADDPAPCDVDGCEYPAEYEASQIDGLWFCERHYSRLEFDADGNPTNLEEAKGSKE